MVRNGVLSISVEQFRSSNMRTDEEIRHPSCLHFMHFVKIAHKSGIKCSRHSRHEF